MLNKMNDVKVVPHMFMPGQTTDAIIKLYQEKQLSPEELNFLRAELLSLNGEKNPRPGEVLLIPIILNSISE